MLISPRQPTRLNPRDRFLVQRVSSPAVTQSAGIGLCTVLSTLALHLLTGITGLLELGLVVICGALGGLLLHRRA